MRLTQSLGVLVIAISFSGCSTIRTNLGDAQKHSSMVYSGIRLNKVFWHCGSSGKYPHEPNWPSKAVLIPYQSLDFVFSFVGDTLLIPYSTYKKLQTDDELFPDIPCDALPPYFGAEEA